MDILPSTARFSSKRGVPNIDLGTTRNPGLEENLKRVKRERDKKSRYVRLDTLNKQKNYLRDIVSHPKANWTLCCLTLPGPTTLHSSANPTHGNRLLIVVEANIIDIYMSDAASKTQDSRVLFKLTNESFEDLLEYHTLIYLENLSLTHNLASKDKEAAKQRFRRALERFHYRQTIDVLDEVESDGTGELLKDRADSVKRELLTMLWYSTLPVSHLSDKTGPEMSTEDLQCLIFRYQEDTSYVCVDYTTYPVFSVVPMWSSQPTHVGPMKATLTPTYVQCPIYYYCDTIPPW